MTKPVVAVGVVTWLLSAAAVQAQRFDLGAHFVVGRWSEFDGADGGVGGRLSWKALPAVAIESELNWYPSEFPGAIPPFSGDRFEAQVAVTAGPRLSRLRPFIRVGAGLVRSSAAPKPFACVAIFPPPLACLMAAGHTLPAFEVGAGAELSTSASTFLRLDAGDRLLKYPGPALSRDFELKGDGFLGHAFRFSLGGGLRF